MKDKTYAMRPATTFGAELPNWRPVTGGGQGGGSMLPLRTRLGKSDADIGHQMQRPRSILCIELV
jgi:hypothetical protein